MPDKPVFILYLYGLGFLNQKGIATLGYSSATTFEESVLELDAGGDQASLDDYAVGLGTDGTRVSSYGPWPSIYWAVTGKTAGGLAMWRNEDSLSRYQALKRMTQGSAWMYGGYQNR